MIISNTFIEKENILEKVVKKTKEVANPVKVLQNNYQTFLEVPEESKDEKKETEDLIKDLKDALEKKDIEDIKTKKDKLQEKAMALATKVYENIEKEQANQENNKETTEDKKDDNVADASYEEK